MTVGEQLRTARIAQKLSFTTIADATKIQPWVLETLEANQLQDQMSRIYARGFLITYAKFLHLAPEPLIAQIPWPKPDPVFEDAPVDVPSVPISITLPSLPQLMKVGAGLAIATALVGLIVLNPLGWLTTLSLPILTLPTVAERESADQTSPMLASVTPMKEPIVLPTPKPIALASTHPLELVITARRTTWIKVRADGKLLTQQRLKRGAKESWTAKRQFELIISKPTQVDLTLNGQSISPFAVAHKGRVLITSRGVTKLPDEQ